MTTNPRSIARLLFATLATACAAGDRAHFTIDTLPSGTIVTRNGAHGLWAEGEGWRLEEDLRIGSTTGVGPTSFNSIAALAVDRAARIYVLDRQDQHIRVFDATGAHVRTIGRQGAGPGEFNQAMGLGWDPRGRLWVVDQGNARYTVLDTAGRLVDTRPRPFSSFFSQTWLGIMAYDGTIYEMFGAFGPALLHLDSTLAVADTIDFPVYAGEAFKIEEASRRVSGAVPFAPQLRTRLDPRGFLWFGVTAPYRIYQRALEGDTVRIFEREYEPLPVSAAERDSAIAGLKWFTDQGGKVDGGRIPDVQPAWRTIVGIDPEGHLWVEPTTADHRRDVFDVFDPEGRYLGRVASPVAFSSDLVFAGDRVYGVTQDHDGIPYVVRARIVRR